MKVSGVIESVIAPTLVHVQDFRTVQSSLALVSGVTAFTEGDRISSFFR